MREFFAGGARGLVEAQRALDGDALDSLDRWADEGLPPTAFTWSTCRLQLPVRWALETDSGNRSVTRALVEPAFGGRGAVELEFRYVPRPQDEEED
jgi:hypothetical protein